MALAYLLGGGSAVGKTTLAYDLTNKLAPVCYMMPEAMDATIPDFDIVRDHEKSAHQTRRMLAWAISKGQTLLCDYAMAGNNDKDFVDFLIDQGYEVHLIFVDTPLEIAIQRASKRKRVVPENVVRDFHIRAAKNFFILRHFPVEEVTLYDNSEGMKIVYHKRYGSIFINDPAKYATYSEKAHCDGDGSGYHLFNTLDDVRDLESMI
jgi:predicted ABC-type ATPase